MPLLRALLLAALLLGSASATDLRIYPSFGEVRQQVNLTDTGGKTAAYELAFSRAAWNLVQPGSLSLTGTSLLRLHTRPIDLDWLTTQEGQPVTVLRAGQAPLSGTLMRADDLLVRLESGAYLNVQANELGLSGLPPRGWLGGGVTARFESAATSTQKAEVSYRTAALSWKPRYELTASGAQASLAALAELRNRGDQTFEGQRVDLFAGTVQTVVEGGQTGTSQNTVGAFPLPTMPDSGNAGTASPISSLGELRGLQRYALARAVTLGRGETLTVPFLQTKITAFTRYNSISTYFSPQNSSGQTSRRYKFTPNGASLPAGTLSVRDGGALVGTVQLAATQGGKPVDIDLGTDPELRFARTVKQLNLEKASDGRILSTTSQITYTLTSTKTLATRVQLRETLYGRLVVVDGQVLPANRQNNVERRVDVKAGGTATISFKVKIGN
ncbi:hypothetical protein E7T06_19260 [Deinococcus sp. Arct2-2]|uniref:hypothetical protein n=1 Tax=Deinococcus sp. Arct2-2 TaxID=2568653 RepID=UPI0010A3341A|nr:hypothetical protein [Deinococcus sp. Arct2-2]THF67795.1 hypothetical protein E7T06_19260 [Deinococcus sp. Arct2-2]